ncbi:MAG: tetratricopeptide repeat protein [Pseudomonadota bacterium]
MDQSRKPRLVGWKRIAGHLGCSERTARRWEHEETLPIHRQQHTAKSTVYAHPEELDAWVTSRATRPPSASDHWWTPSNLRRLAVFTVAALALVILSGLGVRALAPSAVVETAGSDDPIAVDLYDRGRALWLQRGKEPNTRAVKLFTQAVARDENYAQAWQALASAWMTLPTYSEEVDPRRAFDEAIFAADRAVRLDPSLVEARTVMASVAQRRGDWLSARDIFEEAIAADPDNPMLRLWFAEHFRDLGYIDHNKTVLLRARDLAPTSPPILIALAMNGHINRDPQKALNDLQALWHDRGFETPTGWFGILSVYLRLGDFDTAAAWVSQSPAPMDEALLLSFIEAKRTGNPDSIATVEADILSAYQAGLPGWLAYTLFDHLEATDLAMEVAAAEAETGRFDISIVMFDPMFPAGRQHKRFDAIVSDLGYVDYWTVYGAPDFCEEAPQPAICAELTG